MSVPVPLCSCTNLGEWLLAGSALVNVALILWICYREATKFVDEEIKEENKTKRRSKK